MITAKQKDKILHILNVIETGKPTGNYGGIARFFDGPVYEGKKLRQVTYGRSQTTEYGNLKKLLAAYAAANGKYSDQIKPYLPKFGAKPSVLVGDNAFLKLLKAAGEDEVMRKTQDDFFDRVYFEPAVHFFEGCKFTLPLSLLVIYDSQIHSGGIPAFIRNRFPEKTPNHGGDEKEWITAYVNARHEWLAHHKRKDLRNSSYRTQCFVNQLKDNNWLLDKVVICNGVKVE